MASPDKLTAFLDWGSWQRGWSALTRDGYRRRVASFLDWCEQEGVRPERAEPSHVRTWLDTLHPSASVHGHARSALVAYYDHLIDAQATASNPARRVPRPPTRRSVPRSLEPDAVRGLLDTAADYGPKWHCYTGLLCYAALRRGEACGLRWVDVEGRDTWLRVLGKGAQPRIVPIHQSLQRLIAAHREANPHHTWMFPGQQRSEPMSVATATKWMRRILDDAGLPDAVPHQSRHSLAVDLLSQGWDLAVVMEALGHQSLQSTTVYSRARPERVAQAVANLDW